MIRMLIVGYGFGTEYLSVLDDAAFGGATSVEPKTISPTDPAARYTASANAVAGYAYSDNYLVDLKHAVIMDVEATTAIRQAEVSVAKTMLDRTAEQFDLTPSRLVADGGYGSAEMVGWLVDERGIEPHVNLIDKSERTDGTFSCSDFTFDTETRPLCLSRRYGVAKISPRVLHAARGCREGRRDPLSRRSIGLRRLHAQTQVLSEYARTQGCAIRS